MSKKSTATRQPQGTRRPQTASKQTSVAFVRSPRPEQGAPAEAKPETKPSEQQRVVPAAKRVVVAPAAKPRAPQLAARPAPTPKAETPAPRAATTAERDQATRVARARAIQRTRTANTITPEHYSYVLGDLKLIAGVAIAMFLTIIILHFALPGA